MDVNFLISEDQMTAFTSGLEVSGLPNIARSIPRGAQFEDVSQAMIDLAAVIVKDRWYPQDGEQFMRDPVFVLRRVHDAIWMHPIEAHDGGYDRLARYRFSLSRAVELVLKVEFLGSDIPERPYRVDHYRGFSTTNGLGLTHGREIACFPPRVGPRTTQLLTGVADLVGTRDLQPFDRVAHARPIYGIAGHVLWPCGHLKPMDDLATVNLFDALPLRPDELAAFRDDASAQGHWIAERKTRRDVHVIQARWSEIFGD